MPALYALGQHAALVEAQRALAPGELIFAFLDDIYVVATKSRAHLASAVWQRLWNALQACALTWASYVPGAEVVGTHLQA